MLLGCSVKKKLFKLFFGIILIATAAISICVYMHNIESFADGDEVTITHGESVPYGEGGGTFIYYVDGTDTEGTAQNQVKTNQAGHTHTKKLATGRNTKKLNSFFIHTPNAINPSQLENF